MPEQRKLWWSESLNEHIYSNHSLFYTVGSDEFVKALPADARRLHEAVIDRAALARAADEVHDRGCTCGDRSGHEAAEGYDSLADAWMYVGAYLRALGADSGE